MDRLASHLGRARAHIRFMPQKFYPVVVVGLPVAPMRFWLLKDSINASPYINVGPIPVRSITERHDLPKDDSITPYVTSGTERPVLQCFRCCPANSNFTTLLNTNKEWAEKSKVNDKMHVPKQFQLGLLSLAKRNNSCLLPSYLKFPHCSYFIPNEGALHYSSDPSLGALRNLNGNV